MNNLIILKQNATLASNKTLNQNNKYNNNKIKYNNFKNNWKAKQKRKLKFNILTIIYVKKMKN